MLRQRHFYESDHLHFINASTWDFWQAEHFGKRQARACWYAGQGAGAGRVRARRLGRVSGNPKAKKALEPRDLPKSHTSKRARCMRHPRACHHSRTSSATKHWCCFLEWPS